MEDDHPAGIRLQAVLAALARLEGGERGRLVSVGEVAAEAGLPVEETLETLEAAARVFLVKLHPSEGGGDPGRRMVQRLLG